MYRYAASANIWSDLIKYEIDLNGSSVVDDSIENNNLALPGLAENVSYEYKYTIPSYESTNVSFYNCYKSTRR